MLVIDNSTTHIAWALVATEALWRLNHCNPLLLNVCGRTDSCVPFSILRLATLPCVVFFITYVMCVLMSSANMKQWTFVKSKAFRDFIDVLLVLDGTTSFAIGMALLFQSNLALTFAVLCSSKFFLLHLLSRMVTGVSGKGRWDASVQCTKAYLHHVGSFLFISDPTSIAITSIWRGVSMSGHSIPVLKRVLNIPTRSAENILFVINILRTILIVSVVGICLIFTSARRGFALSGVGHAAYLLSRLGPVFRLGTKYFATEAERDHWRNDLSDLQRMKFLFLEFKAPLFTLDVSVLFLACAYFLFLRVTTYASISFDTCTFY